MAGMMNTVRSHGGRAGLSLSGFIFVMPAIGGLITVWKMMEGFGQCSAL
jgi:hypothetical protein